MPVIINGTTGLSGVSTVNLANGSVTQNILANGVTTTGPAFYVYQVNTQSISANTPTKITLDQKVYDTANCFSSSRFTPNVAGYYQINAALYIQGTSSPFTVVGIYKNGVQFMLTNNQRSNANYNGAVVSALVYMNGSTDYVELYGWESVSCTTVNSYGTSLSGFLARAA